MIHGKFQKAYEEQIRSYDDLVKSQNQKKEELKVQAEKNQATYDALNFRDDQFDLSDAAMAIAISLLAIASLTELPALFWLALIPSGFWCRHGTFRPDWLEFSSRHLSQVVDLRLNTVRGPATRVASPTSGITRFQGCIVMTSSTSPSPNDASFAPPAWCRQQTKVSKSHIGACFPRQVPLD